MFWNVVHGYYSVVFRTVTVQSNNVFRVAAFFDIFGDSFDCVFVFSRVLLLFMLLLRH